jgi:hypothetical protein
LGRHRPLCLGPNRRPGREQSGRAALIPTLSRRETGQRSRPSAGRGCPKLGEGPLPEEAEWGRGGLIPSSPLLRRACSARA